ncbi:hypothetical protein FSP39_009668 [Pinctada imbricata]|uniref:Metalloendopeptidase n=1 Tax=Pinctada imbricata TaxID=66713 RepID=A0AA88XN47_PINIB|nr:hypothetical protein FSP39_009668 [Pinctada imbricata]
MGGYFNKSVFMLSAIISKLDQPRKLSAVYTHVIFTIYAELRRAKSSCLHTGIIGNINSKQDVLDAIKDYHKHTCIRFVPRTNEKDYLYFTQIQGCYSNVGRSGGLQEISLMGGCLRRKGTAIHEIMHALGFFHEQSRPDRNSWIQVIYSNIQEGKSFNFDELPSDQVDMLGIEYDYGSIMHYSKTAFSKNGNPTLLPTRRTNVDIGQRKGFSDKDIQKINTLYRCSIPNPTNQSPVTTKSPAPVTPTTIHPTLHPVAQTTTAHASYGWSAWSSWSPCALSCKKKRYRFCINNDAYLCPGDAEQVEICPSPCRAASYVGCFKFNESNPIIDSVEGSAASLADPYKSRIEAVRKCADVASKSGYIVFAMFDDGKCLTSATAYKNFAKLGPSGDCGFHGKGSDTAMSVYTFKEDMDGQWSAWTKFGQCTRSCGGGTQYRYRRCDNPAPRGNGSACIGKDIEQRKCNNDSCKANAKCGARFYTGDAGTFGIINVIDYDNYMECDYSIKAGDNLTISVLITRMDIEYSAGCVFDALMIYDGSDDQSKLEGSYCGNVLPYPVLSTSNEVYIKFVADSTSTGTGYMIYYTINSLNRKACITPGAAAHATVSFSTNFVGDDATYQCEAGYDLIGPSGITCETPRKCSFEGDICGYVNEKDDDFDWSVSKPIPSMDNQKPKKDHSNTTYGHFLFAESTRLQSLGDKAVVTTKTYHVTSGPMCLSFWSYTFGTDSSSLAVFVQDTPNAATPSIWSAEVEESAQWRERKMTISPTRNFQIAFMFTVGDGFGSSAAIDDVIISRGRCPN